MLSQIKSAKWDYARKNKIKLFGSKDAASGDDKKGLLVVCLWTGNLSNSEFMSLFNTMISNCGRESEIAMTSYDQLSMKSIEEENMAPFKTLQQFVHRIKTEGAPYINLLCNLISFTILMNIY